MNNSILAPPNPISEGRLRGESSRQLLHDKVAPTWSNMTSELPSANFSIKLSSRTLGSRPIFTDYQRSIKSQKSSSTMISFVAHAVVIALILALTLKVHNIVPVLASTTVIPIDFKSYTPPIIVPVAGPMNGGGGGGAHEAIEVSKGRIPVVATTQFAPLQVSKIDRPKLEVEPNEQVKLPDNSNQVNIGVSQSPQIRLVSQGSGGGSGFGQGQGGGIGSGHGGGVGPGSGGGYGGGVMTVGGGVTAPRITHSVEPEFTQIAREANFQGSVLIHLIVDSQGNPQDIRVTRHLGMGLDEKAIAAVGQYRFAPAMYQGHPVSVQMVIDVEFHLH
jgi:periplasmic protein TonB